MRTYKRIINNIIKDEKEYGQLYCDFDDRGHDMRLVAEALDVQMIQDDDGQFVFELQEDKDFVGVALDYYYSKH